MKCPKCGVENPETSRFCADCGTQLGLKKEIPAVTQTLQMPAQVIAPGTTFAGRYQVIEELGKGGMGRVFRAMDTKINEEVALKLIRPEIADSRSIERFGNELKMARKISHKNVCRVYHLSEESGTHYITMEFVPGETLKDVIRMTKQLSIGGAVAIAIQVCEGMIDAHRLGVIHRDLKPQNVMIDREGNAKIMDFGIARFLEKEGTTRPGTMVGTPEYMSPEQTEFGAVDQRSDIYSLGIILFEMLTGRVPFVGDTVIGTAMKHRSEPPPHPSKLNPQVPPGLNRIVLRCLEKDREKRYQSAEELLADLNGIEAALPKTDRVIPPKKVGIERGLTRRLGMKKVPIWAFALLAVVAVAVITWRIFAPGKPAPAPADKPSLAIMYFRNNTGDEGLDHWRTALTDLLITDLSQSKLIRVVSAEVLYSVLDKLDQLKAPAYSSDILREIASRVRADSVLVGNYTKAEEAFRINVSLQEGRSGELLASESVEGVGERSFYDMVDELTWRIKSRLELSEEQITADTDSRIATITTDSPAAYKLYSEGRTYHLQADYWRSLSTMQKALEIDPEFAMAWRSVAMSYSNMGRRPAKLEAITKAFQFRTNVSERERHIIEADYYKSWEASYDKALEAYQTLLAIYPDDTIGNTNLGILYFEIEDWDKALECYAQNLRHDPESFLSNWNTVETYEAMGLYDKAHEVIDRYLGRNPDAMSFLSKKYLVCLYQGNYALARAQLEKILSLHPEGRLSFDVETGVILLLQGDMEGALKQFHKLPEAHQGRRRLLSNLYLLRGRFSEVRNQLSQNPVFHEPLAYFYLKTANPEEALKEFDELLKSAVEGKSISGQVRVLHAKGIADTQMGSFDTARRIADEIRVLIPLWMQKKLLRFHDHLMGMIEFAQGNFSRSIPFLSKAEQSLYSPEDNFPRIQAHFIYTLAQAYFKTNNLPKAREMFEKILSLHLGRIEDGDHYARSLYWLGKIYDQRSQKNEAIEHYEGFLRLWKDADPGIPEVEDAESRLAELKK
ncbi:MAG: protein kinase [Candidatus Aminicenantes bacterium]|nr:protein kinase [Candidatus Aminicenantes bacterium]